MTMRRWRWPIAITLIVVLAVWVVWPMELARFEAAFLLGWLAAWIALWHWRVNP